MTKNPKLYITSRGQIFGGLNERRLKKRKQQIAFPIESNCKHPKHKFCKVRLGCGAVSLKISTNEQTNEPWTSQPRNE